VLNTQVSNEEDEAKEGFRKLLKKHAKWCHTPYSLSSQFLPRLETKRPFHRRVNFQRILKQLSALHNAKMDPDLVSTDPSVDPSVETDFTSMNCVSYWIHPDNKVETELFLLKHLTLQAPLTSASTSRTSRTVYLDNDSWDIYLSMVPQSANQPIDGFVPHLVWEDRAKNNDVVLIMSDDNDNSTIKSITLKKHIVNAFLSSENTDWSNTSTDEEWLSTAKQLHHQFHTSSYRPGTTIFSITDLQVIQISSSRTGFIKLPRIQSSISRVYATMDTNILSTRLNGPLTFDTEEPDLIDLPGHTSVFPHVLLQIRWEGDSPRWLEELNSSHLTERISGFNMYIHALSTLVSMPKVPYWVYPLYNADKLPLLKNDIRKLRPVMNERRQGSASPYLTADSKTNSSVEARLDTSVTSLSSRRANVKGYGATSPVVYWSEFETQEEEPFLVPVDESTFLIPWRRERKEDGIVLKTIKKVVGALETEMKTSADGLTTLFYEKLGEGDEEDQLTSEEDSSALEDHRHSTHHHDRVSRDALLNRGYCLCVIGCIFLVSIFGLVGVILNGEAIGIAFVLCGFLISMTLEIVSLVRYSMQGGNGGLAWIGFVVVALAGLVFIPMVAMLEG
jgi:hypothetical protein